MITNFKIFENKISDITKYKIGDYVICSIPGEQPNPLYGRIVDIEYNDTYDYDESPTVYIQVEQFNGDIVSLWQAEEDGEIIGYWKISPEEKEKFELNSQARKYNI